MHWEQHWGSLGTVLGAVFGVTVLYSVDIVRLLIFLVYEVKLTIHVTLFKLS